MNGSNYHYPTDNILPNNSNELPQYFIQDPYSSHLSTNFPDSLSCIPNEYHNNNQSAEVEYFMNLRNDPSYPPSSIQPSMNSGPNSSFNPPPPPTSDYYYNNCGAYQQSPPPPFHNGYSYNGHMGAYIPLFVHNDLSQNLPIQSAKVMQMDSKEKKFIQNTKTSRGRPRITKTIDKDQNIQYENFKTQNSNGKSNVCKESRIQNAILLDKRQNDWDRNQTIAYLAKRILQYLLETEFVDNMLPESLEIYIRDFDECIRLLPSLKNEMEQQLVGGTCATKTTIELSETNQSKGILNECISGIISCHSTEPCCSKDIKMETFDNPLLPTNNNMFVNEKKNMIEYKETKNETTAKIINNINKTAEEIEYALNSFGKMEKNWNSNFLTYKSIWSDMFLNYFDESLKKERDQFIEFWTINSIQYIPIPFPNRKTVDEIRIAMEAEFLDLEFILMCVDLFFEKFFAYLLNKCQSISDEELMLYFYGDTWKDFLNATLNMSQKYAILFEKLLDIKSGDSSPISPILSRCLQRWRYAFFQYSDVVSETVWKLIDEEENGGPRSTSLIPESVVVSYKVLGLIEKSNKVDITQTPCPIDCFEFIDYHMKRFKGKFKQKKAIKYNPIKAKKSGKNQAKGRKATQIKANEKLEKELAKKQELNQMVSYEKEIRQSLTSNCESSFIDLDAPTGATEIYNDQVNSAAHITDLDFNYHTNENASENLSNTLENVYISPTVWKDPYQLAYEPPDFEWRRQKCHELGLLPTYNIDLGQRCVIQWDSAPRQIRKIQGDGNCLFRALVYFLTGHDSDVLHVRMRYLICKYMEEHKDDPSILCWINKYENTVAKYLDRGMKMPGKWGTEVEIQVFAKMLNCIVAVWNPEYFSQQEHIRWNRYNFHLVDSQPTLFLFFEKAHFNVVVM